MKMLKLYRLAQLAGLVVAVAVHDADGKSIAPNIDLRMPPDNDKRLEGSFGYSFIIGTFYEWNTDPTAVPGLFDEFTRRTGIMAEIDFIPINLADTELYRNPLLIMTGNRTFRLTDEEVTNLRGYLLDGGFLYADDCGGGGSFIPTDA